MLDKTGMKGTGRWTIQEAAERNVPATTIAAALDARYLRQGGTRREALSCLCRVHACVPMLPSVPFLSACVPPSDRPVIA